jgi:hypothetical protein
MARPTLLLALLAAAAAPAAAREEVVPASAGSDWRSAATEHDRDRLRHWRDAWVDALAQVNRGANAGEIARGGALFEPDAALPGAEPPPGDYDCRTFKLGRARQAMLDYVAYPAFRCRIRRAAGRLHFTKLTGSQRQAGTIFPDNGRRMIFLGTLMLGDETRALRYGRDRERDLIGLVERVGPDRWRIAFPRPPHESLIDVIELVPRR